MKITSSEEKVREIKKILTDLDNVTDSPLYQYRINNKYVPVIGEGSLDANIVFIGEAPGKKEAETGKPFCGKSGKILDELLASISLDRNTVYVTNIVKDRPPENRDPTQQEIELYGPFLDRQIEIIQPKVLVTLGRFSMEYVLRRYGFKSKIHEISSMHGIPVTVEMSYGTVSVIPLYHPAASIYNQKLKTVLIEDFKLLSSYRESKS